MGEIDTNPIASVQSALSLFGEKRGQYKSNVSISSSDNMEKDLANFKIQLEAKDLVYNQAIHKLDQSEKTAEELVSLLKKSELEKDVYISECSEARTRIEDLQSKLKEMADELSKALTELETELAVNRESKVEAMREMEMMKTKSNREMEMFLELKEAYMKAENEKHNVLSELELAMKAAYETEDELKRQLANKDSLYSETVSELNNLKSEMQTKVEVEIAMLKSELHKGRSRIAAAEAAEERAKIEKTELFLAVQKLALEIEEAKKDKENKKSLEPNNSDYEMRKELEMARTKIWELKNRAEQAGVRAEIAEKAKAEMEVRITKRREKRERRIAAIAALKEETFSSSSNINNNKTDQPLGKFLNLKFKS